MGILNLTPDSFYEASRLLNPRKALERAHKMVEEGADILDLGAESTRPFSQAVSPEEEKSRLLPVLRLLRKETSLPLSVDTYRAETAKAALGEGADIINDIGGGTLDPDMVSLVGRLSPAYILMHTRGDPSTMQKETVYGDLLGEVVHYFQERVETFVQAGTLREQIILDPGIGFGKSKEDNYRLLWALPRMASLNLPLLVGVSRKSFLTLAADLPPEERLEGTAVALAVSVFQGAHILRVHDVKAMKRAVDTAELFRRFGLEGNPC
ncbi:MAG TPA: dihydropteroate synthase [Candidatus Aminicenantes bacterium]|nr:dihydropteroate synthase [Candidatus Aminicenantes bacterium]HPB54607.1 dihydropteroate synthase [Candidatus Aminicenantes bacterium]HPT00834.1 dihydropteroate synthase [Candidatus Aminicenantes bacterium]